MKNATAIWLQAVLMSGLLAAAGPAPAVTILFVPSDVVDQVVGQDLWRYDYQVTGSFEPFGGLNLLFDPTRYGVLSVPQPVAGVDWDVFVVQPDAALAAPGLFTATRLIDSPALNNPASVQFVWLGAGTPGAQPFEVFDASFGISETGFTQAVPEPRTYALYALGLLLLARRLSRTSAQ